MHTVVATQRRRTLLQKGVVGHIRKAFKSDALIQELATFELGEEGLDKGIIADLDRDFFKNVVVREASSSNAAKKKRNAST